MRHFGYRLTEFPVADKRTMGGNLSVSTAIRFHFAIRVLIIICFGLVISSESAFAGGVIKAKGKKQTYKARGKLKCKPGGTKRDSDKEKHPDVAEVYLETKDGFGNIRGYLDIGIGPNISWWDAESPNGDCTTGGEMNDFIGLCTPYRPFSGPGELVKVTGGGINFDTISHVVTIPDFSGFAEINAPGRSFSFFITIWIPPFEAGEDNFDMPSENILWQGSALFIDGQLTLDGFSGDEISLVGGNRIVFHDFTKTFTFSADIFDSIEVDVRYDTEDSGEAMLRKEEILTKELYPQALSITPNPVSDFLVITLSLIGIGSNEKFHLQIFDANGRLISNVGEFDVLSGNNEYVAKTNISDLPEGLYYLAANSQNRILVSKFVKRE